MYILARYLRPVNSPVDILTFVQAIGAQLANDVSFVVNRYNVKSAIPYHCKSGISEYYFMNHSIKL
jgi:hypothetical protein